MSDEKKSTLLSDFQGTPLFSLLVKLPLVRLRTDVKTGENEGGPFREDEIYIFMGEILQMPGHGVFLVHRSPLVGGMQARCGTILSGYHLDRFEVIPAEEC